MYYYKYIKGDTKEDGSRFLPFDDNLMKYDFEEHQYYLKVSGIKTKLGIDLSSLVVPPLTDEIVLEEISDQIYEELYNNPNSDGARNPEFKIARTVKGREGIYKAMIAQLRYAIRTGKNLQEYDMSISKRALTILRSQNSNYLLSRGKVLLVNPDSTDDNGYRNGY